MATLLQAALVLLAVVVWFGALALWPLARRMAEDYHSGLELLKALFLVQLALQVVSFAFVGFAAASGNEDWLHALWLAYVVGALFWLISGPTFAAWLVGRRKKARNVAT